MNALRRWLHALFMQVFADLGVLLRSLEEKPKPRTKR
jgi:hypothetical protein